MTRQKSRLKISGMHCAACAQTIEKALVKAEGVDKAVVNFTTETAYIEYDDNKADEKKLSEIIKETGYNVAEGPQKTMLRIEG